MQYNLQLCDQELKYKKLSTLKLLFQISTVIKSNMFPAFPIYS